MSPIESMGITRRLARGMFEQPAIMATIRDEMGRQLSGMVWQANRLPLGLPTEKLTYFDDQHPSTTDQSIPVPAELIESMPWTSVEIALSVQTQLPT
jgi:hypothetical protein